MRIKLGNTWITGDDARERPADIVVNGNRLQEPVPFLRGIQIRVFDRGNRSTILTFSITRQHTDNLAAEEFIVVHQVNLPSAGTLEIHAENPTTNIKKLYIANAVLGPVEATHSGVSSTTRYTIHGGAPTETDPDA